jgi:hypothetical protein
LVYSKLIRLSIWVECGIKKQWLNFSNCFGGIGLDNGFELSLKKKKGKLIMCLLELWK